MRPLRVTFWLSMMLVTASLLLGPNAAVPANGQTGNTLVLGLDQEPPTLDPHASPSAVTYQIIASVTEVMSVQFSSGGFLPNSGIGR